MPVLTPSAAAAIASGAYALQDITIADAMSRGIRLGCEGMFTIGDKSKFSGKSGVVYRPLTGFGYIAAGEGQFAGDILIATRGTAILPDFLTDFNCGVQRGPGGNFVHAGFNETWKSVAPEIREFLKGRNPTRIHCVGHSLGGAVAALNADFLTAGKVAEVLLYTFGCPRTGTEAFARTLAQRLGAQNVYRVSHEADPIPMIPLFPFAHLATGNNGIRIGADSGSLISIGAHYMVSYAPAVANLDWASLARSPGAKSPADVKSWLEQAAEGHGHFLMGSASLLTMIGVALAWLVKQAGGLALNGASAALTVGATALDQLASLLARAAQMSRDLGLYMASVIKAIFRFLGRTADNLEKLTAGFIRWVLDLLYSKLRAVAARALDALRR